MDEQATSSVLEQSSTDGDDDEQEEDNEPEDDSAPIATDESDVDESNEELKKASSSGKASQAVTMQDLMKNVDADKQQRKGESIRAQTEIWEQLLYVKIKLHAALTAFNQLPRGQLAKKLVKEADEETVNNLKLAQKNALRLVSSLLEAENILLASSSFTKTLAGEEGGVVDSDDEEIESSEDEKDVDPADDVSEEDEDEVDETAMPKSCPVNPKSLSKRLCESEERHIQICADKPRLLKRTRTKKSDVERIGGNLEAEEDEEIYDDDDFYQVLLKELIDRKTSTTQDPVAMTRYLLALHRNAEVEKQAVKKKYVDHRASKDRKIKYLPIPKLVNFYPALPELVEWSHESRNELFKSLFS
ncbi:TRAUB domain protein [Oesophagostomum dentatum]|uniref:TRAUB domain protein n=1 Tax=Oesophagostomum dentatum TaxID=61180 RepID=A0A0B1T2H2_OESDE|nr:TRAUB domain protein [Oesophagostomum dentatum]